MVGQDIVRLPKFSDFAYLALPQAGAKSVKVVYESAILTT